MDETTTIDEAPEYTIRTYDESSGRTDDVSSQDKDKDFSSQATGDTVFANGVLFRLHALRYLEFASAVAEGDTGRLVELMRV